MTDAFEGLRAEQAHCYREQVVEYDDGWFDSLRARLPAGEDPDAEKRALEAKHCDLAVREQFISALASVERPQR